MAYRQRGVLIKPENFSDEMNYLLDQYGDSVFSITMNITKRISDETVYRLMSAGNFNDITGKYRRNWTAELRKFSSRFKVIATVYNKKEYRLTHLLEKGHKNKNQFGVPKKEGKKKEAAAFPHISLVEEWAMTAFEEGLREGISRVE